MRGVEQEYETFSHLSYRPPNGELATVFINQIKCWKKLWCPSVLHNLKTTSVVQTGKWADVDRRQRITARMARMGRQGGPWLYTGCLLCPRPPSSLQHFACFLLLSAHGLMLGQVWGLSPIFGFNFGSCPWLQFTFASHMPETAQPDQSCK